MNRYNHKLILSALTCVFCALFTLVSCSSDDETDSGEQEFKAESRTKASAPAKTDFFADKPEMAMVVTPARANGTYDSQEIVELSLEVYSPRFLTYQTYQKSLGEGEEEPDLADVFLGSETAPWSDNLSLFSVVDDQETPVPFLWASAAEEKRLDIGLGEIGVLRALVKPGRFTTPGTVSLRLKYSEDGKEIEMTAETSVTIAVNHADESDRETSMIHYLIAEGKTKEALDMALEAVQKRPESYRARVALGEAHEASGDLEEALSAYEYGLALFKDEGKGHVPEAPKGLWWKIEELEAKLGK